MNAVEVSSLRRRWCADEAALQRELETRAGVTFVSLRYSAAGDKATILLGTSEEAGRVVQRLDGLECKIGFPRALSARLVAENTGDEFTYVEHRTERTWNFHDASAMPADEQERSNDADLDRIFALLPEGAMRDSLQRHVRSMLAQHLSASLKELHLAEGRACTLMFDGMRPAIQRSSELVTAEHIKEFLTLFEKLTPTHLRTGIDGTLHRISRHVHAVVRRSTIITARVGRTIEGRVLPMLVPPIEHLYDGGGSKPEAARVADLHALVKRGLLLVGPPNVGKTSVLRELSRLLSSDDEHTVVIVDKSHEITGTGVVPHRAIGEARVLTVEKPSEQHEVMIEAVENHSPQLVVVDELSSRRECDAARTIIGRGCALIATVHGNTLLQLMNDPERNLLLGGVASVTLSDREARERGEEKQTRRRVSPPVFGAALELRGYSNWILHDNIEKAVDAYLANKPFPASHRVGLDAEGAPAVGLPAQVRSTPLAGCRQKGGESFGYAKVARGHKLEGRGMVDFGAKDASGRPLWAPVDETIAHGSEVGIWTPNEGEAAAPTFSFGGGVPPPE